MNELWPLVLAHLSNELPEQQVNTWLRPLQAVQEDGVLRLLAPNRYAVDWVQSNAAARIGTLLREAPGPDVKLVVEIGRSSSGGVGGNVASSAEDPMQRATREGLVL